MKRSLLALLLCLISAHAAAAAPERVVSLNLCTDQLALAYARPGQLVGVSFNAANPAFSARAKQAAHYPLLQGEAEAVAALKPDLVLMAEGQNPAMQAWLTEHNMSVLTLSHPTRVEDLARQQKQVRDALGASSSVAEVLPLPEAGVLEGARVAVYYPGGFSDGAHSLMDAFITRAGGVNVARNHRTPHLSLEEMVAADPDVLLIQENGLRTSTESEAMMHHPAIQKLRARRVAIPGAWLICPQLHGADIYATITGGLRP